MKPVVISENILNFNEESSAPIRVTEGTYAASVTGTAVPPDKGDDWEGAIIFRFRIEGGPAGYAQPEGLGAGISIYCDLSEKGIFKLGQTLAGIGFKPEMLQKIIGTPLANYDALKAYAAQIGAKVKGVKVGLEIVDSTYRVGQSEVYQVVKYAVYEEKVKAIPPVAVAPTPPAPVAAAAATPVAAPSNGQADLAATVAASLDNFSL